MRYLLGDQWSDSFLDYYCGPDAYRIQVSAFANLEQLTGIYFVPPRSARLLWNYVREVGIVGVWRKVVSRLQEKNRNEKFASFGIGEISQSPSGGGYAVGDKVAFFAAGFPACVERIVVPDMFIVGMPSEDEIPGRSGVIRHLSRCDTIRPQGDWWKRVIGWTPYAGYEPEDRDKHALQAYLGDLVRKVDWSSARELGVDPASETREVAAFAASTPRAGTRATRKKRGVLFGYGHYAKTNILPNIHRHIEVAAIHEVDPTQTPEVSQRELRWDTAPVPRDDADYDVYLIAGYHNTHAPLAVAALERGAYAVSEKPIAVDEEQLDALLAAMEKSKGGYFGCFHKRYTQMNDYAITDLRQPVEAPIDYHCIVYEVPLPDLHWYRWPSSKSRLVSNGFHWIDHFLYLNGFEEVRSMELGQSPSGTINCAVTLENGAYFTMALTDKGSERIGLQEYVELRAGQVTVRMINNADYLAENRTRVLRKLRFNKMATYKLMYKTIAKRIAGGEEGDTAQSVRVSTRLILDLEDRLQLFCDMEGELDRLAAEEG
jgi:predicted dehydrogenase